MSSHPHPGARPGSIATRLGRVGLSGLIAASAAFAAVGPASAAGQAQLKDSSLSSGNMPLETINVWYISLAPLPYTVMDVTVNVSAVWNASVKTSLAWDSDQVRQGADLDLDREAPLSTGELDVTYVVDGFVGLFGGNADIPVPTQVITKAVTCNPKVSGASFHCGVDSNVFNVFQGGPGMPYINLAIFSDFDISPEGYVVDRSLSVGNQTVAGPSDVGLGIPAASETIPMPCTGQVGSDVAYHLANYSWTPSVAADYDVVANFGLMDPTGLVQLPGPPGLIIKEVLDDHVFDLNGTGTSFDLGALQANDVVPSIDPMGPFSGTEGSAVPFAANVNSQCPISSRVWQFSDGTTSYGPAPQRAFGDNGLFNGQLTATDVTGLSVTRSFDVAVANAAPAANAGPDTTADWGRPVQFTGQATDPGWLDQPTLQFAWGFGDGSPSASGGASTVHSYGAPGTFTGDFGVCDKDGACAADARLVTITKRDTTLGYTGTLKGGASKTVALTAVLIDEYGQPVVGRKVTFVLGGQSAIGTSDASGLATVALKLTQKPGNYPLGVTFAAGDAKYNGSADLGRTFVIGK